MLQFYERLNRLPCLKKGHIIIMNLINIIEFKGEKTNKIEHLCDNLQRSNSLNYYSLNNLSKTKKFSNSR